jgi:hypothetical protein
MTFIDPTTARILWPTWRERIEDAIARQPNKALLAVLAWLAFLLVCAGLFL